MYRGSPYWKAQWIVAPAVQQLYPRQHASSHPLVQVSKEPHYRIRTLNSAVNAHPSSNSPDYINHKPHLHFPPYHIYHRTTTKHPDLQFPRKLIPSLKTHHQVPSSSTKSKHQTHSPNPLPPPMYPRGRDWRNERTLRNEDYGGGYFPDRYYTHQMGAPRGSELRTSDVFGGDPHWGYSSTGFYGRLEPYPAGRRGLWRMRR